MRARGRSTKDCFGGKGGAGDGLERHVCVRGEDEILLSRRRALSAFRCRAARARLRHSVLCKLGQQGHSAGAQRTSTNHTTHSNCDEYVFANVL